MHPLRKHLATRLHRARANLKRKKNSPAEVWDELFSDVQLRRVFPDSITFADMLPLQTQREILQAYKAERTHPNFDLPSFVRHHFAPLIGQGDYKTNPRHSLEQHIEELWPVLRREVRYGSGSLLALPNPYVVAGGRYMAQFYWDSYFIMLGLAASGDWDMVESMVKNCAFSIDSFGFVPNANRSYYLSRSQPPMFALMVRLLARHKGAKATLAWYLPQLLTEYSFWMNSAHRLRPNRKAVKHVVRMPDGAVLNRYFDTGSTPRPEGYKEDVITAQQASARQPEKVYADIRAAAESGWDFSSRWLRGDDLHTIHTTNIVPVDLNSLLFVLEETISDAYDAQNQKRQAGQFRAAAIARKNAITTYCWDETRGFFYDYDFIAGQHTGVESIAATFPLFAGLATQEQAAGVASFITARFLQPGGVVTTLRPSGQQWDWPNGWPPLQWVAIQGLRHYGHLFLADEIKQRWIAAARAYYKKTGKLVEKYNVVKPGAPPQNGEYALQDGFGWTNGVLLALLREDAL